MAFFRKWKLHYKHKKLTEEWALATSMKDLSEASSDGLNSADDNDDDNHHHDISSSSPSITTFDLKYLGSTSIDSEKSKKSTAEAIKSVISLSKAARRKSQRVKLMVSPQGIEVINPQNGDNLLHVSIYKISYCSADAAHDHVFAFVGSENNKNDNDYNNINGIPNENLSCHVFYCPKRKIAHDVTLTVARCFENAYEVWRETVNRKMLKDQIHNRRKDIKEINNINVVKIPKIQNNNIIVADAAGITNPLNDIKQINENSNNGFSDLLIDLTPEIRNDLYEKDGREYLQNTWVSFDDDNQRNNDFGRLLVC